MSRIEFFDINNSKVVLEFMTDIELKEFAHKLIILSSVEICWLTFSDGTEDIYSA